MLLNTWQVKNEDSEVPELNPTRFGNTLNGSTVYHSPGRKLSARFVSDNGVVKKGFKLVYTAVPEGKCFLLFCFVK